MKNRIIKISIVIAFLLIILMLLIIPTAEFDKKIFGNKFEDHLRDKYASVLVDEVFHKAFIDPDYDLIDEELLTVHGDVRIAEYDGREIYVYIPLTYKNQEYKIPFKGTKVIGDKYDWEMKGNDFFPLNKVR